MKVTQAGELPPGGSVVVTVGGQEVALFNVGGAIHAITHRCPHRSGPLAQGAIEQGEGGAAVVRCPIHGWLFELSTGRGLTRPNSSVQTYPVTCEGDDICLGPAQGQVTGPSAPLPIA